MKAIPPWKHILKFCDLQARVCHRLGRARRNNWLSFWLLPQVRLLCDSCPEPLNHRLSAFFQSSLHSKARMEDTTHSFPFFSAGTNFELLWMTCWTHSLFSKIGGDLLVPALEESRGHWKGQEWGRKQKNRAALLFPFPSYTWEC